MSSNYDKLLAKLTEMFQLDQADLDFGIYRIMNSKRDEIVRFLEKDLLPQVKSVLATAQGDIETAGAEELTTLEKQIRDAGMNPDDSPKVQELRAKYAGGGDIGALEQEVFNHLYSFFRRYYDEGDFLSLRRYKEGVYAIPYEGEEVKLHWANADQYYIKTAEHFRDFIFKVGPEKGQRRVHFKLVEAQTEKDNNKEQEKRVFILSEENPVVEENGELIIRFEYRNDSANRKQKDLSEAAITIILDAAPASWKALLTIPTDKDPNRTILAKRLNDFTARNTFDYFIHKDLGGFLRRELDFYIKNEVMHLDDIENEAAPKVEQYLAKVRAIRRVASKIIEFLAQLEEFQKALWLKKKFVVSCDYLVTLDLVPIELYPAIIENECQIEDWLRNFAIEDLKDTLEAKGYSTPVTEAFLKSHPNLTIDTRHFGEDFKVRLIGAQSSLDETITGFAIQGDNFQTLRLTSRYLKRRVSSIYIDPPYNAKSSEILYKNDYKHASWLSLMQDRLSPAKHLLKEDGVLVVAIDEVEQERLGQLISNLFPGFEKSCIVVNHNPSGQQGDNFSFTHEYAYFVYPRPGRYIAEQTRENPDDWDDRNFRDVTGDESLRTAAANCFYPILVKDGEVEGFGDVCPEDCHPPINVELDGGVIAVYPVDPNGIERKWRFARQTVESVKHELKVHQLGRRGVIDIKRVKKTFNYKSNWVDARYSANNHGTQLLNQMIPNAPVSYPKSLYTVRDSVLASLGGKPSGWVVDYFAGSGTTGHAVIALNREDLGKRRFLLVEMGTYFDTVLVPRLRKAMYSSSWTAGKPQAMDGVSGFIKVFRIEAYEDSLANLSFRSPNPDQAKLVDSNDGVREGYMLRYILNAETSGSLSTLNIQSFDHPFEYKLKVAADTVGETREVNVDLVETFNWLLGLRVHTMDVIRGFHIVTGRLPGQGNSENGDKALIIWRDTTENPNEKLDEFFGKQAYNTLDQEFDVIYVNGDNNLQNLRKDDQTWKVRLIEEEFHRLMWDVEGI
ncbi:MAG: site-specific DNA-methyltransferase [Fimbriimonadaceae bacterium]|nr:site-specific DNA-methyltransferase [Fimbriimonadaceae bacterium]